MYDNIPVSDGSGIKNVRLPAHSDQFWGYLYPLDTQKLIFSTTRLLNNIQFSHSGPSDPCE